MERSTKSYQVYKNIIYNHKNPIISRKFGVKKWSNALFIYPYKKPKKLKKYKMISIGYFIVGYIGEDEKDMLEFSSFAHSLRLDFMILSPLRALKYSPLRKIVESTPGYHIDEKGVVFSDQYSVSRIISIIRRIINEFYTPAQYLRVIKNIIRSNLIFEPAALKAFIGVLIGNLESGSKRRLVHLT